MTAAPKMYSVSQPLLRKLEASGHRQRRTGQDHRIHLLEQLLCHDPGDIDRCRLQETAAPALSSAFHRVVARRAPRIAEAANCHPTSLELRWTFAPSLRDIPN